MKFIAIGELMLRLSPPNYEKIVTTHDFIVNYGGAEANVAVSLANLGVDSTFFTVLPNTDLGKSTINYLKANDVHTFAHQGGGVLHHRFQPAQPAQRLCQRRPVGVRGGAGCSVSGGHGFEQIFELLFGHSSSLL